MALQLCNEGVRIMLSSELEALGGYKEKLFEWGAVFTDAENKEATKFCFVLFRLTEHQVARAAKDLTGETPSPGTDPMAAHQVFPSALCLLCTSVIWLNTKMYGHAWPCSSCIASTQAALGGGGGGGVALVNRRCNKMEIRMDAC